MKSILLATVAVLGWHAPVSAQWIVTDPGNTANTGATLLESIKSTANQARSLANEGAMIVNQGKQIANLVQTVNAIAHGNLFGLATLVPQLAGTGLVNPISEDVGEIGDLLSGALSTAGTVGGLARSLQATTQVYAPGARDYTAVAMNARAASAAAQLAFATRSLGTTGQRLTMLPALGQAVGNTADIKDSMDASVRVGMEQATQTAQGNQLLAMQAASAARREISEAQREQAWRASADQLVADASAAAERARGGEISLFNGTGVSQAVAFAEPVEAGALPGDGSPAGSAPVGIGDGAPVAAAAGSGSAIQTMLAQSWGQQAADNATRLGVSPDALAATAQVESGFQNVAARNGSTIRGVWQVKDSTFADAARAAGISPDLAGQMDPATQSAAAAQVMKSAALSLQRGGMAAPDLIAVRSVFQWGSGAGPALARASGSTLMSDALPAYSAADLQANGVTPGMTVQSWRDNLARKLGPVARQPVLIG